MKRTLQALGSIAAVGVLLLTGTAGCSSGPDADGGSESGGGDRAQAMKFAQCMREQGVDMADPPTGEIGGGPGPARPSGPHANNSPSEPDPGAGGGAFDKCRTFLPNGGMPRPLSAADLAQRVKFAQCMRSRGIDYPDPSVDGQADGVPVDPTDPQATKLDEASRACDAAGADGAAK
ncbi:hypothetical protein ACIRRH_40350 [Kitasatospora sp. NPDC101235]|uniref:hypothetical protein n=1 Tax=Kitasatospora sp. NPDC101235 TaxID=3364101 RepID=UPI0037FA0321